jgi:hypothetical protein
VTAQNREPVIHEVWMGFNCGMEDGGCSCLTVRPDGGFRGRSFEDIGQILGAHLDEALGAVE